MENFSPWPDEGRKIQLKFRKATWMLIRPWYNANNIRHNPLQITRMFPITFWFPFLTIRTSKLHSYLGWKPINPALDPAFYWRDLDYAVEKISSGALFVQLSARMGVGEIS